MSMHSYFGDWYRSAGIPPEGIPLSKRWEAIESFGVDTVEIILLAQVFYHLSLSDPSFAERFRKAFNEADPTFPMSGNDRELIVLAGAGLVNLIECGSRDLADLAALCLVCGAAQNVRTAAVPQIPEIAATYLGHRSVQRSEPEKDGKEETLSKQLGALGEPYSKLAPEFEKITVAISHHLRRVQYVVVVDFGNQPRRKATLEQNATWYGLHVNRKGTRRLDPDQSRPRCGTGISGPSNPLGSEQSRWLNLHHGHG
jgi:hypothetical protein